ncbi:hypothetical protein GOODEAATRI_017396 [Goodea atripinnis]|uniref:Uncharacterized protein n=1 Tax=Goodea atripinnis TaxID=208336 RepID=A0ABV0N4E9_9TELE
MVLLIGLAYLLKETPAHPSVAHALYQGMHRLLWALTAVSRRSVRIRTVKETTDPSKPEVEVFSAAASIPGRNRAVFLLMYEELLQRRLGSYEHVTSLRPLQLVSRLSLDITIVDHAPIVDLEVLPLRNGKITAKPEVPVTTAVKNEKNVWKITFSPNIVQQAKISTSGILGDFVIRYDVQRDAGIGDLQLLSSNHLPLASGHHPVLFFSNQPQFVLDVAVIFCVQVLNGHFVHYFAPKDLPVVPKNVVFVIDTSASMLGKKMRQVNSALSGGRL